MSGKPAGGGAKAKVNKKIRHTKRMHVTCHELEKKHMLLFSLLRSRKVKKHDLKGFKKVFSLESKNCKYQV